jgi:hypothetical protein
VSKRLDYTQIAPAGAKALGSVFGYVMQSGLPAALVEWRSASEIHHRLRSSSRSMRGLRNRDSPVGS